MTINKNILMKALDNEMVQNYVDIEDITHNYNNLISKETSLDNVEKISEEVLNEYLEYEFCYENADDFFEDLKENTITNFDNRDFEEIISTLNDIKDTNDNNYFDSGKPVTYSNLLYDLKDDVEPNLLIKACENILENCNDNTLLNVDNLINVYNKIINNGKPLNEYTLSKYLTENFNIDDVSYYSQNSLKYMIDKLINNGKIKKAADLLKDVSNLSIKNFMISDINSPLTYFDLINILKK